MTRLAAILPCRLSRLAWLFLLFIIHYSLFTAALAASPREKNIAAIFGRPGADPAKYTSTWMNGGLFYIARLYDIQNDEKPRFDGDRIYFLGGSMHEGGYHFEVRLEEDGWMAVVKDAYPFKEYERLQVRTFAGDTILLINDSVTGAPKHILRKAKKGEDLRALVIRNLRELALAGVYQGEKGEVHFPRDRNTVTGLWGSKAVPYKFAEYWGDTPAPIIVAEGGKKAYAVKKTLKGLELTPMKPDKDADSGWLPDPSKSKITLTKTAEKGLRANRGDGAGDIPLDNFFGRYTLASQRVLTRPELLFYAGEPLAANLKIMRNEIFARHNYKFTAKDMREYFAAQPWYRPEHDDVSARLSEIESINIALILELEKKEKENE